MIKKFMKESKSFSNVFFQMHDFSKNLLKLGILGTACFAIMSFLFVIFSNFIFALLGGTLSNILAMALTLGLNISVLSVICGAAGYVLSFAVPILNTPHKAAMSIAYGILIVITVLSETPFFVEYRSLIVPCFCLVFAYTALEVIRLWWLDVPNMINTYKSSMMRKKRLAPNKYTYDPEWDLEEIFEIYSRICIDSAAVMVVFLEYHMVKTATISSVLSMLIIAVLLNAFISKKLAAKVEYDIFISPAIILFVYGLITYVYSRLYLVEREFAVKLLITSSVILAITYIVAIIKGQWKMHCIKKRRGY